MSSEQIPQELQLFGKTVSEFHALVDALSNDKAAILRFIFSMEADLAALRQQLEAERARLADVERMVDERIAALSQQRDALREALEALEWSMIGDGCPSCYRHKSEGHWPSCQLDNTLALVRE